MVNYLSKLLAGGTAFTVILYLVEGTEWNRTQVLAVDAAGIVLDNDPLASGQLGACQCFPWSAVERFDVILEA